MLNKIALVGLVGLLISASTNDVSALILENSDQKKTNMESPSKRTSGVHNNTNNMNSKEMDSMQEKSMNSKEMDSMQEKSMNSKGMDSMQEKSMNSKGMDSMQEKSMNSKGMDSMQGKSMNSKGMDSMQEKSMNSKGMDSMQGKSMNSKGMDSMQEKSMNSKGMDSMQGKSMNSKEMDSMQGKSMNSKGMDSMQEKSMNSKEMDSMQGKSMNSKGMDSMQGKSMNSKGMDSMQGKTSMGAYPKGSSNLNSNKNNSNYGLMSNEYLNFEENKDDLLYFRFAYQVSRVGTAKFPDAFNATFTGVAGQDPTTINIGSVYLPAYNDRNLGFNVAFGGLLSENARAELELTLGSKFTLKNSPMSSFTYKKFETSAGTNAANIAFAQLGFNVATLGINGLYDFPVNDFFVPYLGVGVGIAKLDTDIDEGTPTLDEHLTTYPLALNFSAGAKLYFSPKQPINVQYRMLYVSDINTLAPCRSTTIIPNIKKAAYSAFDTDNIKLSATYYIHNLDVGVTFTG